MEIRKISSLALIALAASSFPVSVATPAYAQATTPPSFSNCSMVENDIMTLEVAPSDTPGLPGSTFQSFEKAIEFAKQCKFTGTVRIQFVDGLADTTLPKEIPAGFKSVVIVPKFDVKLALTKPNGEINVKSPLSIGKVKLGVNGVLFNAQSDIDIQDSEFTGNGTVVWSVNQAAVDRISIAKSTFDGVSPLYVNRAANAVDLIGNRITISDEKHTTAVSLGFTTNKKATANIVGNTITATGPARQGSLLYIARPNVKIERNTIVSPHAQLAGIELFMPPRGSGAQPNAVIEKIFVEKNKFETPTPLTQHQPTAPRPSSDDDLRVFLTERIRTVIFQHNHVEASTNIELRPQGQFMPLHHYIESCNYWGERPKRVWEANPEHLVLSVWPDFSVTTTGLDIACVEAESLKVEDPQSNPGGNGNQGGNQGGGQPAPGPAPAPGPVPGPGPQVNPGGDTDGSTRISGLTRFETAVAISQARYPQGNIKEVILARADVAADSVSAVPLAKHLDAPVLLTAPKELHPATETEIKRLLPKGGRVTIMGGEVAVSKAVEAKLAASGYTIQRLAGANRAGTAVVTAEQLAKAGKAKQVLLADGQDWQPDLIAGPAAASVDGVTLLSNGTTPAPETQAYLKANAAVKLVAIGDKAAQVAGSQDKVVASSPTALSVAVAKRFFASPQAVGFATTADFADALAGGAHAAKANAPILLLPSATPAEVTDWVKGVTSLKQFFVYGGETRISTQQIEALTK